MHSVIGILQDSAGDQVPVMLTLPDFVAWNTLLAAGLAATPVYPPDRGGCTGNPVVNLSGGGSENLQNVFPGFSSSYKFIVSNKLGTYHVVTGFGPLISISPGGQFWNLNSDGTCTQSSQYNAPARYKTLIVQETIVKSVIGGFRLKVVR
jgi:hypothetical protein